MDEVTFKVIIPRCSSDSLQDNAQICVSLCKLHVDLIDFAFPSLLNHGNFMTANSRSLDVIDHSFVLNKVKSGLSLMCCSHLCRMPITTCVCVCVCMYVCVCVCVHVFKACSVCVCDIDASHVCQT